MTALEAVDAYREWFTGACPGGPGHETTEDYTMWRGDCFACLYEREAALRAALEGVVYCATCWDNPGRNVCEGHLAPALAAVRFRSLATKGGDR